MFVWELDLLNELLVVVSRPARVDRGDFWSWTHTLDRWYLVKPTYSLLLSRLPASGTHQGVAL